jgi:hypothetical protein
MWWDYRPPTLYVPLFATQSGSVYFLGELHPTADERRDGTDVRLLAHDASGQITQDGWTFTAQLRPRVGERLTLSLTALPTPSGKVPLDSVRELTTSPVSEVLAPLLLGECAPLAVELVITAS